MTPKQTTAKSGMAVTQGSTVTSTGMIQLEVLLKDILLKLTEETFFLSVSTAWKLII